MIQPIVQMIRYGRRGDVWELQTTGSGCATSIYPGVHDPRAIVKSEATSRGTVYLCKACASIWLDPDEIPSDNSIPEYP